MSEDSRADERSEDAPADASAEPTEAVIDNGYTAATASP